MRVISASVLSPQRTTTLPTGCRSGHSQRTSCVTWAWAAGLPPGRGDVERHERLRRIAFADLHVAVESDLIAAGRRHDLAGHDQHRAGVRTRHAVDPGGPVPRRGDETFRRRGLVRLLAGILAGRGRIGLLRIGRGRGGGVRVGLRPYGSCRTVLARGEGQQGGGGKDAFHWHGSTLLHVPYSGKVTDARAWRTSATT